MLYRNGEMIDGRYYLMDFRIRILPVRFNGKPIRITDLLILLEVFYRKHAFNLKY